MAHVRHDEGRGLRLESVVGCGRASEKRRKEMRRARCPSAVAAINRSDRAVARPCVDTVSHRAIRFFFLPRCQLRHRSQNERHETSGCRARGHEENREKVRERMRERERGKRWEERESGRETIFALCESVSDLRNGYRIGRKRK